MEEKKSKTKQALEVGEDLLDMEALIAQEGFGLEDLPQQGEIRKGVITSITNREILIDVKSKADGIIAGRELESIEEDVLKGFKEGDEISVYVIDPEDENGNVFLSYTRAQRAKDWDWVEELLESGETLETEIDGFNKGGLLVPVGQLRGFVPGSLVSVFREKEGETPEERWGELVGEKITLKVIEVNRERKRLILSERDAIGETREAIKDKLLDELEVGDRVTGYVSSLADFGAFVNIQGVDGLVHLSEMSWDHIDHPKDMVKVGQEIEVEVINIDKKERRIGLSIRNLQSDPWSEKVENIQEGQLVQGTITNLTDFGAFASIEDTDLEGLIHISELSEQRIGHPTEVVKMGQTLTLRIIKIDSERHRIGLSLQKVDSAEYASLDLQMLQEEMKAEDAEEEEPLAEEGELPSEEEELPVEEEELPAEDPPEEEEN